MPDEVTQNLSKTMRKLRKGPPNPELIEQQTQRCGDQHLLAGVVLFAVILLLTVGATALDSTPLDGDPVGLSFSLLSLFLGGMAAAVLTAAGLSERRGRSGRAATLQASKYAVQNAGRIDRTEARMTAGERLLAEILGQLKAQADQRSRTDQAVMTIAEKIPDLLVSEHWKGFNSAVREGFLEQTGTDGAARNRKHLGVVPREQDR
jgi:hypothetical protein